ncbi:MAG: c-type cytochrome [Woeseiaceae bacterium]|nr:c-type cytochrome [Woeseiaceae bacterium]
MKIKLAPLFAMASLTLFATQANADSLVEGTAEDGEAKSLPCTACHGPAGNSSNALWPNIAGQNAPYILAQLKAFRDGDRQDPLMSGQAMMLSDEDMAHLAVYYEGLQAAAQSVKDPASVDRGENLYRGGDGEAAVAACIACHGPTGKGNPAAKYPALRGQHADYTAKQLRDYKSGTRVSDGKTRVMRDIAERLSEEDIEALSSYVQGLR